MIGKTTLPQMWWPLMGRPSVTLPYCPVCGRSYPLEQHHPVRRGAGKLFDENGREVKKPSITLCGFGNNLLDADGRPYCHGLAHEGRLRQAGLGRARPRSGAARGGRAPTMVRPLLQLGRLPMRLRVGPVPHLRRVHTARLERRLRRLRRRAAGDGRRPRMGCHAGGRKRL